MMNRKGIEGLPLKYLVIALVASVVIALALQMTSIIQDSVIESTDLVSESITGRIVESTLGEKYTTGFDVLSVFQWSVNSSDSLGEVKLSLINPNDFDVNITSVMVSFGGVSIEKSLSQGLVLHEGESSEIFSFNIPETVTIDEGDRVSVRVLVSFADGSGDSGSLVGFAQ
jgi:hypothetical protein